MKRSEYKVREEELVHLRGLILRAKSFGELDMLLVNRLNEIGTVQHEPSDGISGLLSEVSEEYVRALRVHGPMPSAHAGESIIREEYEELWDQVKLHSSKRDSQLMKRECIQIAASAIHFITDVLKMK